MWPFTVQQDPRRPGFTLIELLAVMVIIAFSVALVSGPLQSRTDRERTEQTRTLIGEIEKAFLGQELEKEPGLRTAGYIPDLGKLPDLVDGQPRGLWTPDTDNDGRDDLLKRCQFMDDGHSFNWGFASDASPIYIWMGWRGPYISEPRDGVLRDGWGNPLVFRKDTPQKGDLTIISPGANGIVSDADTGSDSDIKMVIARSRFMAPVAGTIVPSGIHEANSRRDIRMRLYYAPPDPAADHTRIGHLAFIEPENGADGFMVGDDGYFLFPEVPIGTDRLLEISQPFPYQYGRTVLTYIRLDVMHTLNWLGKIDIRNSYDLWN